MANTEGIFPVYAGQLLNSTFRAAAFPTPFPACYVKFCLDHPGSSLASVNAVAAAFATRTPVAFSVASASLGTIANSGSITIPGASIPSDETWAYWVAMTTLGPAGGTPYWSGTVNGTVGASVIAGLDAIIDVAQLVASFTVAS